MCFLSFPLSLANQLETNFVSVSDASLAQERKELAESKATYDAKAAKLDEELKFFLDRTHQSTFGQCLNFDLALYASRMSICALRTSLRGANAMCCWLMWVSASYRKL